MWRTITRSLGEGKGKRWGKVGSELDQRVANRKEEMREKVAAAYKLLISLLMRPSPVPDYCSLSSLLTNFFPVCFLCDLALHSVSS